MEIKNENLFGFSQQTAQHRGLWQLSSTPLQSSKILHGAVSLKNNLRKMTLLIIALAKEKI